MNRRWRGRKHAATEHYRLSGFPPRSNLGHRPTLCWRMEPGPHPTSESPSHLAEAAVALCGVCAFLELYCTQPLLPMLAHLFHASKTAAGMTVSAATLGVALSAPVYGALTEHLPRKRVIVASLIGVSVPTLLAATSTSLSQLIFWRFLQGVTVPGIIAVLVTYIGEGGRLTALRSS